MEKEKSPTVSVYYTWIDRKHQVVGGGLEYPKIRVFTKDIETMKRVIKKKDNE
jgi:hypothetical protein